MAAKGRAVYIVLIGMILITGIIGGGYFVFASSVTTVLGLFFLFWQLVKNRKFQVSVGISSIAIYVFVIMYFLACLWAIDSGMAFMGAMKFLPVAIFLFIVCQDVDEREKLIELLPLLGSLMTIFSFVMMQFDVFRPIVTVAGRMAGFFQYSNTYALFMLVCLVVSIFRIDFKQVDWLQILYVVVEIFGIYMSGSRIVFALTVFTLFIIAATKREKVRMILGVIGVFVTIAVLLLFTETGREMVSRILGTAGSFSTLYGRILYVRDAVELVLKHPFGMGYYGYYFTQQEIQTGVYSVVNVHNELVQAILDIGIIPGFFLYFGIVKSVVSPRVGTRNKIVLIVILLHSLLDYDLQFLVMWFVLILFLDLGKLCECRMSNIAQIAVGMVSCTVLLGTACVGLSDWFYVTNQYAESAKVYKGNTLSKISMLGEIKSMEKLQDKAEEILAANEHVAIAYSAKARALFSEGDVEGFIKNKLTAIDLAPYEYEEYTDYLDMLAYCTGEYAKQKDMESANMCLTRAENVLDMLKKVEKKTSSLGWKIKDKPQVVLSDEYLDLIAEMRGKLNE